MDILKIRDYCLSLPLTTESTPFDETTLVYKVCGKMYLMVDMVECGYVCVKCEPERALDLRDKYNEITAGYHMNKRHWNDVRVDGDLPEEFIRQMICDSYRLVVESLPRKEREE